MSRINAVFLKKFWVQEVPSGLVNGTNVTFVLSKPPLEAECVEVFVDGLRKDPGVEYTISGSTITFSTAPAFGQTVRVSYVQARGE
jgi:hypothetical protein